MFVLESLFAQKIVACRLGADSYTLHQAENMRIHPCVSNRSPLHDYIMQVQNSKSFVISIHKKLCSYDTDPQKR